jgi:hypothetical protein
MSKETPAAMDVWLVHTYGRLKVSFLEPTAERYGTFTYSGDPLTAFGRAELLDTMLREAGFECDPGGVRKCKLVLDETTGPGGL